MKRFGFTLAFSLILSAVSFAQKSQSYTLTVNPPPCAIAITTSSLPTATAGAPYSIQFAATSTGACSTPLVWVASTATGQTGLPSGLILSSTGLLSGTIPTTYCTGTSCPSATFTVTVTDQNGVGAARAEVKQ